MAQTQTAPTTTAAAAAAAAAPTAFPGDAVLPDADTVCDQRRALHAPAAAVWPWLVQWGRGRAGWYVPARFERALPAPLRAAAAIAPQWQGLQVGDRVADYGLPGAGGARRRTTTTTTTNNDDDDDDDDDEEGDEAAAAAAAAADVPQLEVVVLDRNRALVYKGRRRGQEFTWALLLEDPSGAAAAAAAAAEGPPGSAAASTAPATECVLHLRFRSRSLQTGWKAKVAQQVGKVADGMVAAAIFPGIADRVEGHKGTAVAA